jgi:CO dehydrogenase nickel-insertion accessory protein CooC1
MRIVAIHHSRLALARAEKALELSEDLEVVRKLAKFANQVQQNDSAR